MELKEMLFICKKLNINLNQTFALINVINKGKSELILNKKEDDDLFHRGFFKYKEVTEYGKNKLKEVIKEYHNQKIDITDEEINEIGKFYQISASQILVLVSRLYNLNYDIDISNAEFEDLKQKEYILNNDVNTYVAAKIKSIIQIYREKKEFQLNILNTQFTS